jgi:hypothetical protein
MGRAESTVSLGRQAPAFFPRHVRSMINIVPTFRSTMMMPLSIPEAGHFGM